MDVCGCVCVIIIVFAHSTAMNSLSQSMKRLEEIFQFYSCVRLFIAFELVFFSFVALNVDFFFSVFSKCRVVFCVNLQYFNATYIYLRIGICTHTMPICEQINHFIRRTNIICNAKEKRQTMYGKTNDVLACPPNTPCKKTNNVFEEKKRSVTTFNKKSNEF